MEAVRTTPIKKPVATKRPAVTATTPAVKVFLIGMMGAGKSFWGEKLKKKFKLAAYDLDGLIEAMEEKSVTEIFEEEGEEAFR